VKAWLWWTKWHRICTGSRVVKGEGPLQDPLPGHWVRVPALSVWRRRHTNIFEKGPDTVYLAVIRAGTVSVVWFLKWNAETGTGGGGGAIPWVEKNQGIWTEAFLRICRAFLFSRPWSRCDLFEILLDVAGASAFDGQIDLNQGFPENQETHNTLLLCLFCKHVYDLRHSKHFCLCFLWMHKYMYLLFPQYKNELMWILLW